MLTGEEFVDASALHRRGWSISAIARHLGRDRKTIRAYLEGRRTPGVRRRPLPDHFARFEPYVRERLFEDPHLWGSTLFDEVTALGYPRSYVTFVREIRKRRLRPRCEACAGVKGRPTIEIAHPPGEEIQWDWLELPDAPWGGEAHLLVGTLSHSGKVRAVFAEGEEQAHLVEALDGVLRRLGGTARRWRVDRMATVCDRATGRLLPSFAAVARYYGVHVDVCPPRRANRKGAVESRNHFLAQRFWWTLQAKTLQEGQAKLDRFSERIGDRRRRGRGSVAELAARERLLSLPALPYPAVVEAERVVSAACLISYQGNRYSVPPGLHGQRVTVRRRLGSQQIELVSTAGSVVACHRLVPAGAGALRRHDEHRIALERVVLQSLTSARPCRRKANRPPGEAALKAAAALAGEPRDVVVALEAYARYAEASR
ncbi:IS21 family transposase [Mycolicibacterium hassiacum]|uniref:IS21 family transposase n=1 Tax=Mycolicibacterium hassiacum TaxID=46351 RepID=UPI0023F6DDDC|nr:IS21 family transposase [Mycolicibacterium hassiacum]